MESKNSQQLLSLRYYSPSGAVAVEVVGLVFGLGVDHFVCGGSDLLLLSLLESNDTAGDLLAHALSHTALTALNLLVFSHVVIVTSFVENHGATNDGVGSTELSHGVSRLVLGTKVPTALDLLEVTDATLVHVVMRVSSDTTVGVEDISGGATAVLKVTELVDLETVEAWVDSSEFTDEGGHVSGSLSDLNASGRVGVSKEIELAGSADGLLGLLERLPVLVD